MEKKTRKRNATRFSVMLIPDTTEAAKSFELTFDRIIRILIGLLALLIVLVSLFLSIVLKNYRLIHGDTGYMKQIEKLKQENELLLKEKEVLSNQLLTLSEIIEEKQSEEREKIEEAKAEAVPNGNPIEGKAAKIQEDNEEIRTNPNRIVFLTMANTSILAAAAGVVTDVHEDADYGNYVEIDHRNGYRTVYRIPYEPRVSIGDFVKKGEVLGMTKYNGDKATYEVMKDGVLVSPDSIEPNQ